MTYETIAISNALRQRLAVSDQLFDRLYPRGQRHRSEVHWTPTDVALRACAMLAPSREHRVLDVGAGVGKICLIGALTTAARWCGIERDREMVHSAITAAQRLGVAHRTAFMVGEASAIDWSRFDAFYLFNPFAEALFHDEVDAGSRREIYVASVELVQRHLAVVPAGTRVVTYHGFGGDLPDGFELAAREPAREDELRLWIRAPRKRLAPTIAAHG